MDKLKDLSMFLSPEGRKLAGALVEILVAGTSVGPDVVPSCGLLWWPDSNPGFCSSVLIHPRFAVTAAHAVFANGSEDRLQDDMFFVARVASEGDIRPRNTIKIDGAWRPDLHTDLALVRLKRQRLDIAPPTIVDVTEANRYRLCGFGAGEPNGDPGQKRLSEAFPVRLQAPAELLILACANIVFGSDSGGAVVEADDQTRLAAIIVRQNQAGARCVPLFPFKDWIDQTIAANS